MSMAKSQEPINMLPYVAMGLCVDVIRDFEMGVFLGLSRRDHSNPTGPLRQRTFSHCGQGKRGDDRSRVKVF